MIYKEFLPAPVLQPYIFRFWILKTIRELPKEKSLPDGMIKMYIFLNDTMPIYTNERGDMLHWKDGVGGHSLEGNISLTVPGGVYVVGCTLKPYFFHLITKIPIDLINNSIIDLHNCFGCRGDALKERLQNAADIQDMIYILNHFYIDLCIFKNNIGASSLIHYAQNQIIKEKGSVRIDKLGELSNVNLKTLERKFKIQIGMTPKMYSRLLRFNHAISLHNSNPGMDWSDISYCCGYYDQNHLIKEFKHFAGAPPIHFFEKKLLIKDIHLGKTY